MSPKWNYIFGAVTIGVIIGGTIYAIKKSKDADKEQEEAITLDQAREMLADRDAREGIPLKEDINILAEKAVDVKDIAADKPKTITAIKASSIDELYDEEDVEYEDGVDEYMDFDEDTERPVLTVEPLNEFNYFEDGIDPKEDTELRHDPNSPEARHQYIRMELADWEPSHTVYRIMIQMFEMPFIPTNDGDELLRTQIIDHKVRFYGWDSIWNREVAFSDVIFHYARLAEFNCGESVAYWVEYFLDFNEFEWDSSSQRFDTLIMRLNSHSYFNEERETFGLFGLTRDAMDQAIRIANQNIDRSVTYEIEFNEFLKSNF